MAKFVKLDPAEVQVGRERLSTETRQSYREALAASDAGRIELDRGERPSTVKRYLSEAAKESDIRVRSTWENDKQQALLWKKIDSD